MKTLMFNVTENFPKINAAKIITFKHSQRNTIFL